MDGKIDVRNLAISPIALRFGNLFPIMAGLDPYKCPDGLGED